MTRRRLVLALAFALLATPIAGLASDLELALALHAEVRAGLATASSSQAVPEVSDRIARAQMREDQAEARSGMVCWP